MISYTLHQLTKRARAHRWDLWVLIGLTVAFCALLVWAWEVLS